MPTKRECCACQRSESDVSRLITGTHAHICTDCVEKVQDKIVAVADCAFCVPGPSECTGISDQDIRICSACFSIASTIAEEFKVETNKVITAARTRKRRDKG